MADKPWTTINSKEYVGSTVVDKVSPDKVSVHVSLYLLNSNGTDSLCWSLTLKGKSVQFCIAKLTAYVSAVECVQTFLFCPQSIHQLSSSIYNFRRVFLKDRTSKISFFTPGLNVRKIR